MSDSYSHSAPNGPITVTLAISPLEEEEDDLDTLALAGQIRVGVQRDIAQLEGYAVNPIKADETTTGTRGIDLILLITTVGVVITTHKDLLASLFQAIAKLVEALGKRGRVGEIQIIVDGKTLILRDVSKQTAQDLIAAFEAQHPGASSQITPATDVKVNAKVSKRRKKQSSGKLARQLF